MFEPRTNNELVTEIMLSKDLSDIDMPLPSQVVEQLPFTRIGEDE